jgi:DNA polymerase-3 subunit epsilon
VSGSVAVGSVAVGSATQSSVTGVGTSASAGYAVFDIETTGVQLHADSIVEIAVVHVDSAGRITGSWDTLLHPAAGVGPTYIHGITDAMVRDAPSFADVAGHLHGLFAGRIAVAHNLPGFDGRFLAAHFDWSGIQAPEVKQGVCTLKQARRHLPLATHKLGDCCAHLGIDLKGAHQALDDTMATARLLGHFIGRGVELGGLAVPAAPRVAVPVPRRAIEQVFRPRAGG